tara:strand:- start:876 stop:1289 length:414 start_codon:yes stop_codon:yes gene_type:complete
MPRYSSGRFAKRISDRDGFAYPYNEMVKEWTGVWVHTSEYEPKSPLLNPTNHPTDPQSLAHPRAQQVHATVPVGMLGLGQNSFDTQVQTITQWNPIPAPGAYETVAVPTMQPLAVGTQKNNGTRFDVFVGVVTVVIS